MTWRSIARWRGVDLVVNVQARMDRGIDPEGDAWKALNKARKERLFASPCPPWSSVISVSSWLAWVGWGGVGGAAVIRPTGLEVARWTGLG